MAFLLEDTVCVLGVPVCRVSWFLVHPQTLLLASPTADAAVRHHADFAHTVHESLEVDFTLYDIHAGAATDKREAVDYSFLSMLPQPPKRTGQTPGDRQAQLKCWIEDCLAAHSRARFPELLRGASPTLYFEYDSVLKNIKGGDGSQRGVQGFVSPFPDSTGATAVRLSIPLLLSHAEKAYQALNNVAVLYCKFAHHEWRAGYQVSAVEADLHLRIRVLPKTGKLAVMSEDVELRISDQSKGDAAASLVPFLVSCVDVHGLPRLSLTSQGGGFIDYLPQLDEALYRRLREPLHFMKLILGLVADFGSPVELSVSCKALSAAVPPHPPASPARKTAVFCVVDGATSIGFAIGLHYHSGGELPSVEATCTQYLDAQHAAPLSLKVRYPKTGAAMRRDDDGFIDVEDLRVAVVHGVMECMAASMSMF